MPTIAEPNRCPDCDLPLGTNASACGCGWRAKVPGPGPDLERIEADRQRSIARATAPRRNGPMACQSTLCPPNSRAIPGTDLCKPCAALEKGGRTVPRIRKPDLTRATWRGIGEREWEAQFGRVRTAEEIELERIAEEQKGRHL